VDADDVQAVEEVLAESAAADELVEVAVGGGHEAHVDVEHLLAAADRPHLAVLEHAQQLHLQRRRELGDLVEEQRAAVRLADQALGRVRGTGERPLHVAEQLRLEQLARDRAAVDRDERPLRAAAGAVDAARHQLLAGAALARDEHVRVRRRHLAHQVVHALDAGRLADDPAVGVGLAQAALEQRVLAPDASLAERARHRVQEVVVVERLDDVVDRAVAQRLDGALDRRVARHQDDRDLAVDLAQPADRVEPRRIRQLEIGDDQIDDARMDRAQAVAHRPGHLGAIALAREQQLHHLREPGIVVDHEDALPDCALDALGRDVHGCAPGVAAGSSIRKQAPPSG
jgi:hypothetical protein